MSLPVYLLVDGHSVLFGWNDLRVLHQRNPRAARDQLISILSRLHDSSDWRVTLIFDGKTRGNESRPSNAMIVAYASQDETADSLIEKTVASFPHPEKISVVTNDRAEGDMILSLGAHIHSVDWLIEEINKTEIDLQNLISQTAKKAR